MIAGMLKAVKLNNPNHMEWHLTPRGWERGRTDAPQDRVLTMHCEVTAVTVNCHEIWSCGAREKIKQLIEQYGHAPEAK